jgi:ribosome-associated translation inhibitor RaiA
MMKVIVRQSGIAARKWMDSTVKEQMLALSPLRQIDEANVQIARESHTSPPFRVHVHLVTPGPDIFAEARDHTFAAALGKVIKRVTEEIRNRAAKRQARRRAGVLRLLPQHQAANHGTNVSFA